MKRLSLIIFLLTAVLPAFAGIPIKGHVVDQNGDPIPGVTIIERGSSESGNAAISDSNGAFSISVESRNSALEFSCMGFTGRTEPVGARTSFEITLTDDTTLLDEVVVVGYGVQKKGALTGSIASINTKTLTAAPTDNVTNMLAGKLPGLVSRQTTGLPGENEAQIYIRGISTTGSSSPLVLVDGVERDFANLDPSEIADITILKDAASAAVYGVKGANGVILVTTRRGDVSRNTVTYNGSVTFSTNSDMITLLDGPEYARWHNMATDLDGIARDYSDREIDYIEGRAQDPQGVFGSTDWLKLIFKDFAVGQNHNLTISGGNRNVRYFVGGSMLDQDGIIDNVWFKRYNLRSNIDISLSERLTFKLDVSGRMEERHQNGVSAGASDPTASLDNGGKEYGYKNIVFYAISARPTINPTLPDGTYLGYYNPLAARDASGFMEKEGSYVQTSATLQYDVPGIKGLTARAMISYDFQNVMQKKLFLPCAQTTPQYGSEDASGMVTLTPGNSPHLSTGVNQLTDSHSYFNRYTGTVQLNYSNTFGKHELGGDIVWEQSGTHYRTMSASKQNFAITEIPDLNFSEEVTPNSVTGSHSDTGRQGLLGRASWNYDQRYLLSASLRADWSAKFAKGRRLGIFPAVSAGWRISEEDFFAPARSVVDNLKLRASWGMLGNDSISDFMYVQGIALSSTPTVSFNGRTQQSLYTTSVPNDTITWEITSTWNAGLDLSLWQRRLTLEADAFYKVTSGILQSQAGQMPPSIGGNYPAIINGGIVDVRGFEAVLGHHSRIGEFSFDAEANVSFARNRYISTNDSDNIPPYQSKIGQPLGGVLGYISEGLYQNEEELASSPKTSNSVRVGDIKYKDLNGDGRITLEDRTWIAGSQIPEMMFGLNLGFAWKGFDAQVFFQGAARTDIMLCGTYSALGYSDGTYYTQAFKWGSNPPKYLVEGSWTPEHTDAEYPRLSTATSSNNVMPSDFWKRDASYLRLKNLQLGYSFPVGLTRKFFVEGLRIYCSASNLLTLSKLSKLGIDPEAPSVNNGYYPQQRVFSLGANITF